MSQLFFGYPKSQEIRQATSSRELWSIGQVPKGQEQANLQEMHQAKILSYFQASPIKIASHETRHAGE